MTSVAFFSRKLNPAQRRYTTTERELLAIVETLKEFRTILLGHKILVYTNHKWNTELKGLLRIFFSPPKNVAQDGHKQNSFSKTSGKLDLTVGERRQLFIKRHARPMRHQGLT